MCKFKCKQATRKFQNGSEKNIPNENKNRRRGSEENKLLKWKIIKKDIT